MLLGLLIKVESRSHRYNLQLPLQTVIFLLSTITIIQNPGNQIENEVKKMLKREVTVQDRIFLFIEEEYEVRKNKKDKIQYYTDKETGESGMSENGLANACGTARSTLQHALKNIFAKKGADETDIFYRNLLTLFDKDGADEIYLINDKSLKIIKDQACAKFIKYYGYEAKSKRTNAQRIYDLFAAKGIRNFIQEKTGFEKQQFDALDLSIEEKLRIENQELKKENKELKAQNKVLARRAGESRLFKSCKNNYDIFIKRRDSRCFSRPTFPPYEVFSVVSWIARTYRASAILLLDLQIKQQKYYNILINIKTKNQ
ncbi:hypothetical protein TI03_02655 [Achromatium sp. WMS1]|nr:hypothetical protein TI03_02655 [Achromatium sp. WMS1]